MEFKMTEKIVVLYASPYKVQREASEGGGYAEGVTVSYLYGDTIQPKLNPNGSIGQRPAKASLPTSKWNNFLDAPGLYEGYFSMDVAGTGKPQLRLDDVTYLGHVKLDTEVSKTPDGPPIPDGPAFDEAPVDTPPESKAAKGKGA